MAVITNEDLEIMCGVEKLINDEEFDISGGATIEDWSCNGYLPLYASGYNITLFKEYNVYDNGEEDFCICNN